MPPVLLTAGLGLDRDTGAAGENPAAYGDLRNTVQYEKSMRLRGGLGASVQGITGEDVICHVAVFKAAGQVIYITFNATTLGVNIYTANLQGQSPVLLGAWGTLANAAVPPQFTTAESYGVLLLAHDEPNVAERLATQRYDPADMTLLAPVQADLDGLGAEDVKFRGVYEWLGYVFGWGFGTDSDPDRPEVVRSSSPDDPTSYDPNHYFRVGVRTVPVIGLCAVGSSLAVLKAGSFYRIDGDNRANWSIQLVDPFVGLVSARAVVNVNGRIYWWSPDQGPRMSDGSVAIDAGLPLDLTGNPPADLPGAGEPERVFAVYYPDLRHLVFHHPATTAPSLAYAASLRDPSAPLWQWWTLGLVPAHGAIVNADEVSIIEPGTADNVVATGASGSAASISVTWDHNDIVGDETIELWYETPGGVWSKLKEFSYASVAGPTGSTTYSGGALVTGTGQVALRYRRGGRYAAGYESSDPDSWPSAAKASVTIIVVALPTAVTVSYDFTNGTVTVNWTNGDAGQDIDVQLYRDNGAGEDTSAIIPLAPATTSTAVTWAANNVQDKARQTGMTWPQVGSDTVFARVRHRVTGVPGAWVAAASGAQASYQAAPGGADIVRDSALDRASVSLGTGTGLTITLPTSITVDVRVRVTVNGNVYGLIPNNGGCGLPIDFGGGSIAYPASPAVLWFDQTYPAATPSPVATGFLPAIACATCSIVGQYGSQGSATAVFSWRKVGDFANHGYNKSIGLPGNIGGPFTCGV